MQYLSNLNMLPADEKIIIANASALVDKTTDIMNSREYFFDLTSKMQLKSGCKTINKLIKQISKGKNVEKSLKELQRATTCLQTDLNGILEFYKK